MFAPVCLAVGLWATGVFGAPVALADDGDMIKCFIAHGIAADSALTVGNWKVGTPLIDPPGGIDRNNWFRVYAVCAMLVHHVELH